MRIFFDTEFFEDGRTIELISIGMIREDGRKLYLENSEFDHSRADDWLKENVLPKLTGPRLTRSEIAHCIVSFAGEKPEFWAYYADYDWVALCQLYGRMIDLPKGWPMYCRDLKQEADRLDVRFEKMVEEFEHSAIHDAEWAQIMFRRHVQPTMEVD